MGLLLATEGEGGVATVIWLIVDENHRSEGLGKRLMQTAASYYRGRGFHKIKLTVPGLRAKKFYQSIGMKEEGYMVDHWYHTNFWSMGWLL